MITNSNVTTNCDKQIIVSNYCNIFAIDATEVNKFTC